MLQCDDDYTEAWDAFAQLPKSSSIRIHDTYLFELPEGHAASAWLLLEDMLDCRRPLLALPSRAYSSRAGRRAESRRRHRVAFAALLLWQIPRRSLCCRSPKCTSICLEQRIPSSSGLGRPLRQRAKRPLTLIASLFVKERRSLWTAKAFQRQPSDLTHNFSGFAAVSVQGG